MTEPPPPLTTTTACPQCGESPLPTNLAGWPALDSMVQSRPVQWCQLILTAEQVRVASGYGLAETWGHIHSEEYDEAKASLDALVGELGLTTCPRCFTVRPRV